jgi:hypothetical protein
MGSTNTVPDGEERRRDKKGFLSNVRRKKMVIAFKKKLMWKSLI